MAILNTRTLAFVSITLLGSVACIGTAPQQQDPSIQGDYDDGDEEHRPGQPCLLCHDGTGYLGAPPGGQLFAIAGTTYGLVDDDENDGLEGVRVTITDANGFEFGATSNRTGNFMFEVDTGRSDIRENDRGQVTLPQQPVYPLSVKIARDGDEQEMKTKIWREGSCAHCHGEAPGVSSVGRVALFEDALP